MNAHRKDDSDSDVQHLSDDSVLDDDDNAQQAAACRCDELTQQRDEFEGRFQRALADLQNYQKRTAREREQLIQQTQVDTIEQFLFPVIDDLDRAIQAANEHGYDSGDPLFAGLTMVHQRMLDLLKQYGIEPIDATGKPFDPLYHQAVMDQPSDQHAEGSVMDVISRGYTAAGKTIRPARVIVARKTAPADSDSEPSEQEQE